MSNHPDYNPLAAFLSRWLVQLFALIGVVATYHFGWMHISIIFAYTCGMAMMSTLNHL